MNLKALLAVAKFLLSVSILILYMTGAVFLADKYGIYVLALALSGPLLIFFSVIIYKESVDKQERKEQSSKNTNALVPLVKEIKRIKNKKTRK